MLFFSATYGEEDDGTAGRSIGVLDLTDCLKRKMAHYCLGNLRMHGSADQDRLDYGMLSNLLKMIERCQPKLH
jgi:hypothetical protein